MIGLKRHTVDVVDHDPSWTVLGVLACQTVRNACGELLADVQHVGSTAVPDLPAKPILDIAAAVVTLDQCRNWSGGWPGSAICTGAIMETREATSLPPSLPRTSGQSTCTWLNITADNGVITLLSGICCGTGPRSAEDMRNSKKNSRGFTGMTGSCTPSPKLNSSGGS